MAWDPHRPPHKAQPSTNSTPFARGPPVSFPSRRTVSSLLPHHTITPHHASPSRRIIPPPQTSAPQRLGQAAPDRHAAPRSIMSRVIHQIAQSHCAANTTSRCITSATSRKGRAMARDPQRPPHKAQPSRNSTPFARGPPSSFPSHRTIFYWTITKSIPGPSAKRPSVERPRNAEYGMCFTVELDDH